MEGRMRPACSMSDLRGEGGSSAPRARRILGQNKAWRGCQRDTWKGGGEGKKVMRTTSMATESSAWWRGRGGQGREFLRGWAMGEKTDGVGQRREERRAAAGGWKTGARGREK